MTKYGLLFKMDELGTVVFSPTPTPLPRPATNYSFLAQDALEAVGATPLTRGQFQKQTLECVLPN